eukprot:Partr_v1_DN26825_c0_g2_i1_m40447 putative Steroid-5-alpha-reductase, alpha polypeptide 1 (3-oxo-5 alpha-steroid delta 4-dehydrogenase alpha 1)
MDFWLLLWFAIAPPTFLLLLRVDAPYGRFSSALGSKGWLKRMDGKWAWAVQEIISPLALIYFFLRSGGSLDPRALLAVALWTGHYIQRAVIYPLKCVSMADSDLVVVGAAAMFNIVNAYFNGHALANIHTSSYGHQSVWAWRSVVGLAVFGWGAYVNVQSDNHLVELRALKGGGSGQYFIPTRGLFRLVSCANYFGEIVEWLGFFVLVGSPAALSFVVWTCANLVPRALRSHAWYHKRFGSKYPADRRAVIPWLL